jgi:septal ring factor EnvC (AmiA/AmiB activator)
MVGQRFCCDTSYNDLNACPERLRQQSEAQQLKAAEFTRLQDQCQSLRDQASKLEISYFQTSENLTQANATVERMRTESANLRAERSIWKVRWFSPRFLGLQRLLLAASRKLKQDLLLKTRL